MTLPDPLDTPELRSVLIGADGELKSGCTIEGNRIVPIGNPPSILIALYGILAVALLFGGTWLFLFAGFAGESITQLLMRMGSASGLLVAAKTILDERKSK